MGASDVLEHTLGSVLAFLLCACRWYVYSVATPVLYAIQTPQEDGSLALERGTGSMHAEKNWGAGFPERWLWAQGHGPAEGARTGQAPVRGAGSGREHRSGVP